MLAFFYFDGFAIIDRFSRSFSDNPIIVGLIFFGIIIIGSDIFSTPSTYYQIFVIEEKFGFNKMDKKTFFIDKIKSLFMTIVFGTLILSLIIWFYEITKTSFWLYAWGLISVFTLIMNMFYAKLIVPIFNNQTPLEAGELRDTIEQYAKKVGFQLKNIYVICLLYTSDAADD